MPAKCAFHCNYPFQVLYKHSSSRLFINEFSQEPQKPVKHFKSSTFWRWWKFILWLNIKYVDDILSMISWYPCWVGFSSRRDESFFVALSLAKRNQRQLKIMNEWFLFFGFWFFRDRLEGKRNLEDPWVFVHIYVAYSFSWAS